MGGRRREAEDENTQFCPEARAISEDVAAQRSNKTINMAIFFLVLRRCTARNNHILAESTAIFQRATSATGQPPRDSLIAKMCKPIPTLKNNTVRCWSV